MVVRRHRLGFLDQRREFRSDLIADTGHHVVAVEEDVGGSLPAGLDHDRLDAAGSDPLVRSGEAFPVRISHAERGLRRRERGLRGGLRCLDDLVAPMAAEQSEADAGFQAVVGIHKDGVSGPLKPRFLDGGITGRAVDVVRRLRRERSDDQDDVAEGLRERRGPAVGLRFRVVIQRGSEELQSVDAERSEEGTLRDFRIRDRAREERGEHDEGEDDFARRERHEQRESDEAEEGLQGSRREGAQMLRIRGRAQDHLARPEHRAVPEDGDSVDPIGIRNAAEQGVRREGDDRDQLERPEQHEANEREQERAAEVHPAAEAVRQRDRAEGRHVGGQPDRHAAQEDPNSVERRIYEEIGLHHREREDRWDNPPGGRRDEQPPCDPRRLGVALARGLRPEDVHQPAFTASMIRRKACPSRATSTIVPVTTMSAPARVTRWAASGVRMPPPTTTGMSIASRTARMTRSGTGSGAPLPASRYTSFMPSIWAARAYWTATVGFLREIRSASPTSPARIPGPTTK